MNSRVTLQPQLISSTFDGDRLRQARQLALKTKQNLADAIGVTPAAISQYESGVTVPRPDLISTIANELDVRPDFFVAGRPHRQLETTEAFFRSVRSTSAKQRAKSTAFTEQLWELVCAIEKYIQLPEIDLPGLEGAATGETSMPSDPVAAAQMMRKRWHLGSGPIPHLVRLLESKGIVVVIAPPSNIEVAKIDAFSTLAFTRPVVVLSLERADDVLRLRFTAAHELGHLVLHGNSLGGDPILEREADKFAAEFLTPSHSIQAELPRRADFTQLIRLSAKWGVSVDSLLYRCRELGLFSESTSRRAFIRLKQLRDQGAISPNSVSNHPGEVPKMLKTAVELAADNGLSIGELADQLKWKPNHVRQMLGVADQRPVLRIVRNE